jgi:methionine transaminase
MPNFTSKLPQVGSTIFSTMSTLAAKHNAVNLGQGFADYEMNADLCKLVQHYMLAGKNQYAPMQGVPELRIAIADKFINHYSTQVDAESEITITPGGTYGIYAAISTIVNIGDEVIVLEPAYDSYVPNIILNGGIPILVRLNATTFAPDWDDVKAAITNKTKAIIVNTPNNPGGYCFTTQDWAILTELVLANDMYVVSDEVYEHIVLDGQLHQTILLQNSLRDRCFAVFSFGKIYHNTGWKIGYVVACSELTAELRKIHQYLAFACNTPVQYALAEFMQQTEQYKSLPQFFQRKRDILLSAIATSSLKVLAPAAGSFFQTVSFANISNESDNDFCIRLTRDHGITAIPVSAFYRTGHDQKLIRLCFAKKEQTLLLAGERLAKL